MTSRHVIADEPIHAHAFNKDSSQMAISIGTDDVFILSVPKNTNDTIKCLHKLQEHSAYVTGIDWAPNSNKIVSCSADKNAIVWTQNSDQKWKPSLCVLRIDRAALCVKWSPMEDRFAVGSGSKKLCICSFNTANNMWASNQVKKHFKSSITCVDWHPDKSLVACGSTDFRVRVITAVHIGEDGSRKHESSCWGEITDHGTVLFESTPGAWIFCISFSPDGSKLAWAEFSSKIYIADTSATTGGTKMGSTVVHVLSTSFLPFTSCLWVGTKTLLYAGHDCLPIAFSYHPEKVAQDGSCISVMQRLEVKNSGSSGASKMNAMKLFQQIDRMNITTKVGSESATVHENTISQMRAFKPSKGSPINVVSSIGRDGLLVFWDLPALTKSLPQLVIQ